MAETGQKLDFGAAEAAAFGSLLQQGWFQEQTKFPFKVESTIESTVVSHFWCMRTFLVVLGLAPKY